MTGRGEYPGPWEAVLRCFVLPVLSGGVIGAIVMAIPEHEAWGFDGAFAMGAAHGVLIGAPVGVVGALLTMKIPLRRVVPILFFATLIGGVFPVLPVLFGWHRYAADDAVPLGCLGTITGFGFGLLKLLVWEDARNRKANPPESN